ncbi:L,D-transpeptidase family protein [Senegalia massiliensis]|uniref:L,D-transpeptidase family protein n=1 Tax=Senegalia massiliensis TaxID=1720316 RepID=UPI001F5E82B5|nr:L,D-transpeptidase family protein [Senegalia massiliensis]
MFKGGYHIIVAIFCLLIVIILGNKITYKVGMEIIENYQVYNHNNTDYDNLWILINIDSKELKVIDLDTKDVLKKYTVATGKENTPTPLGNFRIVEKAVWSGGFGSRWMRLNVPWGIYGIHGTNKPKSIGLDSSHGCIRMNNRDIEELYDIVNYNTRVTINKGQYGIFGDGFRILKPGDRGRDVLEVQKRLKLKGYYKGTNDGIYGETMKIAVLNFKKDNNLESTHFINYEMYRKLNIILME